MKKSIQYFTKEYLERCKGMTPDQILEFLEWNNYRVCLIWKDSSSRKSLWLCLVSKCTNFTKFNSRAIYPNNFKNWEFDKKAPQHFELERVTIAREQGASEDQNFEVKPTPSKTNFRSCLGIASALIVNEHSLLLRKK
jgi:hypothetical protein